MARYSTVKCALLLCIMFTSIEVTSTSCKDGYYYDENGGCMSCPSHCLFCDSVSKCLSCENGYWGAVCERECFKCKAGTGCEKTNGFCFDSCRDGLSGILCDASCNKNCSSCNRTNINLCLSCAPGRYPARSCDRLCSNCNNTDCDENGVCTSGCVNGYWNKTCESDCPKDCINKSCEFGNGSCRHGSNRKHIEHKSDKGTEKSSNVPTIVGIVVPSIVLGVLVGIFIFRIKRRTERMAEEASHYSSQRGQPITEESAPFIQHRGNVQVPVKQKTGTEKLLEFIQRFQTRTDNDYQDEFNQLLSCHTQQSLGEKDSIKRCEKQDLINFDQNCVTVKMDNGENVSMNASFIKTGNSTNSVYIACEGPTKDVSGGFDCFWMMLWQLDCKTVVMLGTLDTLNVAEAELKEYWPLRVQPEYYGQLLVKQELYEKKEEYTSRTFLVKMGEETKTIIHLQYKEWPEKGCAAKFHNLLTFLKLVYEKNNADRGPNKNPIVVHGSTDRGRTGTFIALDMLVHEAEDMVDSTDETELDVSKCVKYLRTKRTNIVENVEQYIFLHEALSCHITQMLNLNRELAVNNLNML